LYSGNSVLNFSKVNDFYLSLQTLLKILDISGLEYDKALL